MAHEALSIYYLAVYGNVCWSWISTTNKQRGVRVLVLICPFPRREPQASAGPDTEPAGAPPTRGLSAPRARAAGKSAGSGKGQGLLASASEADYLIVKSVEWNL